MSHVASDVDLHLYTGLWYEIARYDSWFEGAASTDNTATYTANAADGTIQVHSLA